MDILFRLWFLPVEITLALMGLTHATDKKNREMIDGISHGQLLLNDQLKRMVTWLQ